MRAPAGLNDKIHARLLATGRSWAADEIGAEFLRLRAGSAAVLVRALLQADARFLEEAPGRWVARPEAAVPLRSRRFALAWVEAEDRSRPETWRLHLRSAGWVEEEPAPPQAAVLVSADPAGWDAAFGALRDRRIATLQPGLLGRIRQWMGRRWAVGGDEEAMLDLHSLARLALTREGVSPLQSAAEAHLPRLFVRWGLGPVREDPEGVPLPAMETLLDRMLGQFGDSTEEELLRAVEAALSPRPVPMERFEFSLQDLESVPETSGIYRFLGEGDALLYVGKAVSLRRRLASYFRPLPPEPTKREELLRAIRRFEFMPLPSELEALLRECRAIREHRPPWNVQIEVHELETLPPQWWWPLVFLAPGSDPHLASALLLTGPEDGYLFHLPRSAPERSDARLAAWLDRALNTAGAVDPGRTGAEAATSIGAVRDAATPGRETDEGTARSAGILPLAPPEVRLAVRFFLRERDRLDRIDAPDLTDGGALSEALHRLAGVAGPE